MRGSVLLRWQGFDRYLARDYDGAALWYLKSWWLGYEIAAANGGYLFDKALANASMCHRSPHRAVQFRRAVCPCLFVQRHCWACPGLPPTP